jgi:hypothetical protein
MTHIFTEWKTRPTNGPWIVRVYNNSDREIASWIIKDRTEREAYREAMSEVEQCWPCREWSMTPVPNRKG